MTIEEATEIYRAYLLENSAASKKAWLSRQKHVVKSAKTVKKGVKTAAKKEVPDSGNKTDLSPSQEKDFQKWYAVQAKKADIDPDPDNPLHQYDYRGAFLAGEEPELNDEDGLYHWSSEFKDDDHPNRYVKGVDTKSGKPAFSDVKSGSSSSAKKAKDKKK